MKTLHMIHSLDCKVGDIGTTVRLGNKWLELTKDDKDLELCVCEDGNHDVQGHAEVVGTWFGNFYDVPAKWLEYEHEERSRQYSGLLESMKRAYGDKFTEDSEVTLLAYLRKD